MSQKRRFPLAVKDALVDFTLTRNAWLTVNNEGKFFYRFGRSFDKHSFRLGLEVWKKREYDYEVLPEQLSDVLSCDDGVLRLERQKDVYYYILKCNVPFRQIEPNMPLRVREGEIVIAVDRPFSKEMVLTHPEEECDFFADQVLSFLKKYFQKHFCGLRLFYVIQFSPAEKYTFFIQASLGAVGLTTEMFKNKLLGYQCEEHWHIETVIHEALVNAITYGSQMDYSKKVSIAYEIGQIALRVFIQDAGEGFDVKRHMPLSLLDKETISGRGIRLMKHLSSSMAYNRRGNAISLLFNFKHGHD